MTGVLLRRGEDSRGGHMEMEVGLKGTIYNPGGTEDCQRSAGAGSKEPGGSLHKEPSLLNGPRF